MKKIGIIFLSLSLVLTFVFSAKAQSPVIYAPETLVYSGKQFSIPIRTIQFKHITGMQFIVSWDPARLRYKGLRPLTLDLDVAKNFGTSNVERGILRFLWFDEALNPATLPDSTSLFAIDFEPVNGDKGPTAVQFEEDLLTKIEVYNDRFEAIDASFQDGKITVEEATTEAMEGGQAVKAAPNPFSTHTALDFKLEEATEVRIRIFDHQGRMIYERTGDFGKGRHSFQLDREMFSGKGAYICQVRCKEFNYSQKLILL